MRVTGGQAKGYTLEVPRKVSDLRPTQEVVREAVFNLLDDISGYLVLDLYAGSGSLGIEALSRGARFCDFVEKSSEACKIIHKNLNHSHLKNRGDIYCERADQFLDRLHHKQKYDLVFLDPPYSEKPRNIIRLLPKVMESRGLLIYLHGKRIVLTEQADRNWIGKQLVVLDNRSYGSTHLSILRKQ